MKNTKEYSLMVTLEISDLSRPALEAEIRRLLALELGAKLIQFSLKRVLAGGVTKLNER